MYKNRRKKSTIKHRYAKLFFALGLFLLVFVVLAVLEKTDVIDIYKPKPNSPTEVVKSNDTDQTIDMSPAKPSDNTTINQQKESDPNQPSANPPANQQIQIILNRASVASPNISFRSTVSGVKDGACIAHLDSQSDSSVKKMTSGNITYQSVTSSYVCNIDMPISSSVKGSFNAYVTYSDNTKSNVLAVYVQ